LEEAVIHVVKKDETREPFQREKIVAGLASACWKRKVSQDQIEAVVKIVEQEVYSEYSGEIHSHDIGEMVMHQLGDIDQVAYVRFASVYREFKDVRDFVDELQPMLKPKS